MNWFVKVMRQYVDFKGRARRAEYWYFALICLVVYFVLAALEGIVGAESRDGGVGLLSGLFSLATLLPSLAVGVRRLHDTNRSGWWLLITLIPLVGLIVFIVFAVQRGTGGDNRFGPDPLLQPEP